MIEGQEGWRRHVPVARRVKRKTREQTKQDAAVEEVCNRGGSSALRRLTRTSEVAQFHTEGERHKHFDLAAGLCVASMQL